MGYYRIIYHLSLNIVHLLIDFDGSQSFPKQRAVSGPRFQNDVCDCFESAKCVENWPKPFGIMRFVLAFAYFDLYHDTTVHRAGVSVRISLAII